MVSGAHPARVCPWQMRVVELKIVIEVTFDLVRKSNRYESGYALRFPRILRVRTDKLTWRPCSAWRERRRRKLKRLLGCSVARRAMREEPESSYASKAFT